MNPILLHMTEDNSAELYDPLHRHRDYSNFLYSSWISWLQDNLCDSDDLSFKDWINKFHNKAEKNKQVDYIPAEQVHFYQVTFENGLAKKNQSLLESARNMKRLIQPIALVIMPNDALYAVDMITSAGTKLRVHHSSVPNGGAVYFAAEAFAVTGNFTRISDKSGHYTPNLYTFVYGLTKMQEMGANFDRTQIEVDAWKGEYCIRNYSNAIMFLKLYVTEGFDHADFSSSVDNLDFLENLVSNSPDAYLNKIYFVKDRNDLFSVTIKDGALEFTSFYDKYKMLQETSTAEHVVQAEEPQPLRKKIRFNLD